MQNTNSPFKLMMVIISKMIHCNCCSSIGRKNAYYRETSAVIWAKLACPSERVQRERHSACALNGHASFSQITADVA